MKMSSFIRLNLSLVLLLMSFNKILNIPCASADLTGLSDSEKKQTCFSLSNTEGNEGTCCLNGEVCALGTTGTCPKSNTEVPNNCGMAGIYEPQVSSICKEISLVQGYCCYVKLKKKDDTYSSACIRTKKLNKNKNEATDQITKYVGNDYTIESVDCHGANIKYYWLFIIATMMLL